MVEAGVKLHYTKKIFGHPISMVATRQQTFSHCLKVINTRLSKKDTRVWLCHTMSQYGQYGC